MRPLEIVLVLLVAGLLAAHAVRAVPLKYLLALAAAGLATATLSVFLGQARWQMTPVYVVLAVSSLLLLKRSFSHVALRSLGVALGTLLLATGAAASLGLPILTLPPPDGPHAVGVTSASLVDTTRDNAFFGVPGEARELYVQAWYPGARAPRRDSSPRRRRSPPVDSGRAAARCTGQLHDLLALPARNRDTLVRGSAAGFGRNALPRHRL